MSIRVTKLFFIAISLNLLSKSGQGQVMKFKAFEVYIGEITKYSKTSNWQKCDFLVVVNGWKNKLNIYSSDRMDIDFVDSGQYKTDSIGAILTHEGVDQEGEKCSVVQRQFNEVFDGESERIIIVYPDGRSLIYRLKTNE